MTTLKMGGEMGNVGRLTPKIEGTAELGTDTDGVE